MLVSPSHFVSISQVENKRFREFAKKRVADGRTDGQRDRRTDGLTDQQTVGPMETDPLTLFFLKEHLL